MAYLTISNQQRLYYRTIEGSGNNETARPFLIFLHEALGCTAMWSEFADKICSKSGCPGLIYDRLGHGKSSPNKLNRTIDYLQNSALDELPRLIARTIPNKPYILVGHSDGGSISLLLGAKRPPMLIGIITEAAHVFVDQKTLAGIQQAEAAWESGKFERLRNFHGEKTATLFRAWADTWQAEWFQAWNIENILPDIEVPMLVIQGLDDKYGTLDQAITIADKSSGYSQLELVEQCGHVPHREAEAHILKLMASFITRLQFGSL